MVHKSFTSLRLFLRALTIYVYMDRCARILELLLHEHEVDRVACSLVSDSMALLRGTQRRASVHADAPRFAVQKIIQKNFEFVAVSKFLCMCSGTF